MYCETKPYTIGLSFLEKNAINASPEYQRQAGAWGREKQQLFLHTLFGQYDVPKIYMHKLPTNGGRHTHALVDGKQRLQCIWDFMDGKIQLGDLGDKAYEPSDSATRKNKPYPKPGNCYDNLSPFWQEKFKSVTLDIVIIHDADIEDVEELFTRLNNGESLKGAEKRNAYGGKMCKLIRELANHKFFKKSVSLTNKRYQHYDVIARFLLIEDAVKNGASPYRDLKKKFLDNLVKDKIRMGDTEYMAFKTQLQKQINVMSKMFDTKDPLLKRTGYLQLYYLFAKEMENNYASAKLFSNMKKFIPTFELMRNSCRNLSPEDKKEADENHSYLDEFELLMQQGNDKRSLTKRVSTMRRFFLDQYPQTKLRDKRRNFSDEERYIIYTLSSKKCNNCDKQFKDFSEFEADHVIQWATGGTTSLNNARALCKSCNAQLNKRVA